MARQVQAQKAKVLQQSAHCEYDSRTNVVSHILKTAVICFSN